MRILIADLDQPWHTEPVTSRLGGVGAPNVGDSSDLYSVMVSSSPTSNEQTNTPDPGTLIDIPSAAAGSPSATGCGGAVIMTVSST